MPEAGERRSLWVAEGIELVLCWIPPGWVRIGSRDGYASEQPVHEVHISQGFWLGQTPVTQRQFAVFDPAHENGFHGNPDHPASGMNWDSATAFCDWLNVCLTLPEWLGCKAGLPTEAQWEYACRAGTHSDYHSGDGEDALHQAGWFDGNSAGTTHSVGLRTANGFGLHDLHGNVWEWCRDVWEETVYRLRAERAANPATADAVHPTRVVRGGAWDNSAGFCRAAFRNWNIPGDWLLFQGFRVAVFPGPSCPDRSGASEGSDRGAGRPAGSARAAGAGTTSHQHVGDGMSALALSSLDGQEWERGAGAPDAADPQRARVTRVVIGKLNAEKPLRINEALWQQVLTHWPTITHLHLWSIQGLKALPELPPSLECLDLRHCQEFTSLPVVPDTLITLDLAGCTALQQLPAGATPALRYLHLDGCTGLRASAINTKIGACAMLEELTLAGCAQLHELEEPARGADPPLRKLVLKGCTELRVLPDLSAFGRLNHLNLNGCAALDRLPPLPILPDPDPPRAWDAPVRGLRYVVTHGCERLREYCGLDLRPVHLSTDADDSIIHTLRALHCLGQPAAALVSSKLLLLGSGRVGKTTLAKALQWAELDTEARTQSDRGHTLDPTRASTSTHGIQFWPWQTSFVLPSGPTPGRVHIWDFAGQEIYHNTHRLFAASGSVFVIVCCDRATHAARLAREVTQEGLQGAELERYQRENEYREVRYWLDYVCAALGLPVTAADRLPVLLVHSGAKGSDTGYLLDQAGPYRAAIAARTLPLLTLDCRSDAFLQDADFQGLRAELARRLGNSADQLGIRVPAYYGAVHAEVESLLGNGQPRADQAVYTYARWGEHLQTTLRGRFPPLALQPSALHAVTRHLHRIGQVFWLDELDQGDVIVDQELGAEAIYALCTRHTQSLWAHAGVFTEPELAQVLARELRADGLKLQHLLRLLETCGVCLPLGAGRWQALNPALLPELGERLRAEISAQWFAVLNQMPDAVNHSYRLCGKAGMQLGAADFQATLAWLLRWGIRDGEDSQRLPRLLAGGELTGDSDVRAKPGERRAPIRWRARHQFWRNGAQVVWTPEFDHERIWRWREAMREPAPGESPGDPLVLRLQYAPFDVENGQRERAVSYAGSLYIELLSRDEAAIAPRLQAALVGEGGPLAFLGEHYRRDDQRPEDLPAERLGHPRGVDMLPWRCARNPTERITRHDVAISVRGSDVDIAEPLYQALCRAGLSAYYYLDDQRGKLHGAQRESGLVEIYDYLDRASCLILICSNRYFDLQGTTPDRGNIYCPVELAAAVHSVRRDTAPRAAGRIFPLAVSRAGDGFAWGSFDQRVTDTLQSFQHDIIQQRPSAAPSPMRARERDWVNNACDDLRTFLHQVGGQAKQAERWDGRPETRDAVIAAVVTRVRAVLGGTRGG